MQAEAGRIVDEFSMARQRMVANLRERRIADERVLEVMGRVPRHLFVPDALRFQAYRDGALPINSKQTISQPFIVARMTELLEVGPGSKVLEIGTGSGYQAAILAELARRVYSIERMPELEERAAILLKELGYRNITTRCADGTNGWPAYSPYDGILVAAGSPLTPEPLVNQLSEGGRLVIPVGKDPKEQELIRITRQNGRFYEESFGKCSFVPLIGEHGWDA